MVFWVWVYFFYCDCFCFCFYVGPSGAANNMVLDVWCECLFVCLLEVNFLKNRIKLIELHRTNFRMLLNANEWAKKRDNWLVMLVFFSFKKQVSNGSLLVDDLVECVSQLIWCWDCASVKLLRCCSVLFCSLVHHSSMSFVNMRERTKWLWWVDARCERTN